MSPITLDFSNMVMERLGPGGIDPERLGGDLGDRFRSAHESVESARRSGEMGFFDLPYDSDVLGHVRESRRPRDRGLRLGYPDVEGRTSRTLVERAFE